MFNLESIYLNFNDGVPQLGCTLCGKCNTLFGKSLCHIKNRGCCWYYPKFTLYEIHKMVKSKDGLATLKKIINHPDTEIFNYYIHSKGYFDKENYNKYIKSNGMCNLEFATKDEISSVNNSLFEEEKEELIYEEKEEFRTVALDDDKVHKPRVIHDKTMFFRACPFVESGEGCTINPKYRSYVCNFFICDEITEKLSNSKEYDKYIKERNNYIRWIEWENENLQEMLCNENLNLIHNFDQVIEKLKSIPLEYYDFAKLQKIDIK